MKFYISCMGQIKAMDQLDDVIKFKDEHISVR